MSKVERRVTAMFGALALATGCNGYSLGSQVPFRLPPLPEKRTPTQMQAEAESAARHEGYEIVQRNAPTPVPALGLTDFVFQMAKEGKLYSGPVVCPAQKECSVIKDQVRERPNAVGSVPANKVLSLQP